MRTPPRFQASQAAPDAAEVDRAWSAVRAAFPPSRLAQISPRVFAKLEYELPTRSFKVRGALAALAAAVDSGDVLHRVLAASAGNHGQGLGFAAQRHGLTATIVVPRDCPDIKVRKMEAVADVIRCQEAGYDAAERLAKRHASEQNTPFVSPFDDTMVMAGNGGTMMREILDQCPDLGSIVVPVGGGGLLAGILSELSRRPERVTVLAVQSQASPAFVQSLATGTWHDTWPPVETLAEGLEGGTGATGLAMADEYGVDTLCVTEKAIAKAMVDYCDRVGVLIEGSAAVALAALNERPDLEGPVVVVLTGANVDRQLLPSLRMTSAGD